ncbi:PAS domain S-box protein [Oscillatoria sp. FACHB-1407]|uniref:PAS domain S-box protein n=1 Tax=Oscillatoria sp. FACHB-1407 TaxID=2692847 RepID=UPI0016883B1A|nr:PAS domain S-box protein [Oscillatoria sp. FACHB-1407]MBD2462947.1 PAS domain S-box protein [Oscillatoria sp. FACHB-1407]
MVLSSDRSNLLRGVAQATSQLLTSRDFDSAIHNALTTLGQVTQVDRVYICDIHPHPLTGEPASSQRFEWVHESVPPLSDNPDLDDWTFDVGRFVDWLETLQAGQAISCILRELSPDEIDHMPVQDVYAILIVPIFVNDSLWGFIGFDDCKRERQWSKDEEAVLQTMAASLGGAIARQQAEMALRQSEAKLQRITANIPGMIYQFLLKPDGTRQVLFASSGCQELLELSPEFVQADFCHLSHLCHPDDRANFEQSVRNSSVTMQPWNWEGRIITASGQVKWLQGFSRPERLPDGSLLWDGVLVDITERKRVEEASRHSESRYRAMLDATPDLMFRLSLNGRYLDFKGSPETDMPREAIVGQYLHDVLPPEVAELSLQTIRKTLETGELQICEYQLLNDKGLRDYEARLVVSGKDEVLAIVRDVTDRKRVEAELRASEERLQSFFEATSEAVIIHDFNQILDVNPSAEGMLGYSCQEMIGMPVLDLVAPDHRAAVVKEWRSLTSPDQSYEYESVGLRKDGSTFMASVCAKPLSYRGQRVRVAGIRDITERKQAEAAILQSEARNRALVNAIPDLMFLIHRDGTYLDCKVDDDNTSLLPAHELIGRNIRDVLPSDLAQQRLFYIEQALKTGTMQRFEYQLQLNGRDRASSLYRSISPNLPPVAADEPNIRDYEARVVVSGEDEALAIVRDITDRKRSEVALRTSEEKFSKAFRSSPNPMTIATLQEGRFIEVNDSYVETSGYSREESLGRTSRDLQIWVNQRDRETVVKLLTEHGSVRGLEFPFRIKSGDIRVGLFSAEIIQIGDEMCLIDSIIDITERKRSEERDRLLAEIALRIRQSLNLQQIFNTTVAEVRQFLQADRVFIGQFDAAGNGQIVSESGNPAFPSVSDWVIDQTAYEEMKTVYQQGSLIINDVNQIDLPPRAKTAFERYQTRATLGIPIVSEGRLFGALVAHQCEAPREWHAFEVNLMEQLATQVAIAVQQAQLYNQVQTLNAGLERQVAERTAQLQQKMEELQDLNDLKDEFLNAFSHDLKTPVMGISLVLKNLLNQAGDPMPISRSILERMMHSSDHQLHLITSLLQAHSSETRGVTLHYELVQLSLLTQVIVEDLEPLIVKNQATFDNQVPPNLPLVNADPVQLRRVFENLITNALHHNPPGIHITLNATLGEEMVRFTLNDTGMGMSKEVCDRLFQRYTRGPKSRHSTGIGLGLYLCRQIITAHGGEIGVYSIPGEGSTFWLTLPLAIPSVAQPNAGNGE